jgi:Right handed beta helix region
MTLRSVRTAPVVLGILALAIAGCSVAAAPSAHKQAAASGSAGPSSPAPAVGATTSGCGGTGGVAVSTAAQLSKALAAARPGQRIVLAAGTYQGDFVASTSGTAGAPITLCGDRNAVLQGTSIKDGYVFHLDRASWWRLEGFTVENGQKGVVADGVTHDLIDGLYVHGIGDEAIHLREFSSYNTVSHNVVRDTGLDVQFFGEGIYVGTANKNWCKYTGCQPDTSNYNVIIDNNIADTTAENIDIKEGTTGGTISGNTFNGTGMVSSAATSWVNVKGNDWTIENNTGTDSIGNGFSVHQVYPGWGLDNVFRGNDATFSGAGYGIYVQSKHLGTVVACNNVATGVGGGLSNEPCSNA